MDDIDAKFQQMFEFADLIRLPVIGGWTRKVQEMEQHVARGGTINEAGSFFVQASRTTDPKPGRVIDFFACLPENRRGAALVIAVYCSPPMLEEYPDVVAELKRNGVHAVGESWSWTRSSSGAAGRYVRAFRRAVVRRRIFSRRWA